MTKIGCYKFFLNISDVLVQGELLPTYIMKQSVFTSSSLPRDEIIYDA